MIRRALLALPLLVFVPLATAAQENGEAANAPPPAPRPAKLMTLDAGRTTVERQFFGRVRARETVDLAFQVGGQIVEFPASEGTSIAAGGLVAQLDLEPFERQLEEARVQLDKAERDLERLERLSGNAASEVQIQDARTQRDLARIAVADAEDRLEDATLNAPFDALVARREVANFSTVSAGQPVVRLHDMSEKQVAIDVPEVLFRRAAGAEDQIKLSATFPESDTRHPLVFREFEAETADVGQTYRLTLAFTEDPGERVLPGSSTTVNVVTPLGSGSGIVIPETALVFDADRDPAVMVFEPSEEDPDRGTVRRTPVTIDMRPDGRISLAEGPETGTEIVATGASQLEDGQTVRRFTGIGE
ncbi:Multidrug resistance protein MexA precursor [Roseivivax jejudonensis]|uniref:Multidrug resistance protein MexA n=1 Tax=Roseivivax jejudonensis TaxID=1529041 RepID=A0A1X6ZEF9_9RHOB|nr:efflux RND transporter periplasmic adaptor subunit [Roseivivax jejudonensis]SLN49049.1 Multidrug resistance protein MexA precursor [Roseivivax jejudonensis]